MDPDSSGEGPPGLDSSGNEDDDYVAKTDAGGKSAAAEPVERFEEDDDMPSLASDSGSSEDDGLPPPRAPKPKIQTKGAEPSRPKPAIQRGFLTKKHNPVLPKAPKAPVAPAAQNTQVQLKEQRKEEAAASKPQSATPSKPSPSDPGAYQWAREKNDPDFLVQVLIHQPAKMTQAKLDMNLIEVLRSGHVRLAQYLLKVGWDRASLNAVDKDGQTPLHKASEDCHVEMVKLLLEYGADTSLVDAQGDTVAHVALKSFSAQRNQVLQILLDANPGLVLVQNKQGKIPANTTTDKVCKKLLNAAFKKSQKVTTTTAANQADPPAKESEAATESSPVTEKPAQNAGRKKAKTKVQAVEDDDVVPMKNKKQILSLLEQMTKIPKPAVPKTSPIKAKETSMPELKSEAPQTNPDALQAAGSVEIELHDTELLETEEEKEQKKSRSDLHTEIGLLRSAIKDKPWEIRFTREFKEQLFSLRDQPVLLKQLIKNLSRLAEGEMSSSLMKQLKGTPKHLNIFESPCRSFSAHGERFLWQYATDYSPRIKGWTDTIRLWKICLNHDRVREGMQYIIKSHEQGRTSTATKLLKPAFHESTLNTTEGRRIPRNYNFETEDKDVLQQYLENNQEKFTSLVENEDEYNEQVGQVLFAPPAVSSANSYNVLKFYAFSEEVLGCLTRLRPAKKGVLRDVVEQKQDDTPEFPFIPDERENELITWTNEGAAEEGSKEYSSILLVGRSGTGKTSIAVNRMWAMYNQWYSSPARSSVSDKTGFHQVFVTANRVLRDQVRKAFHGMKMGSEISERLKASTLIKDYPSVLKGITEDMFPLFLTSSEWIIMVDGTLDEPFFARNSDATLKDKANTAFHEEAGMLDSLPESDEEMESDDEEAATANKTQEPDVQSTKEGVRAETKRRGEVDYKHFADIIWPKISNTRKEQTKNLSASAVFTEIHSYIKGSAKALDQPEGRLGRMEYLSLDKKMAPNFQGLSKGETEEDIRGDIRGHRALVYELYEEYEKEKRQQGRYDISDVIFHIWKRLDVEGYKGSHIDSMFVDECQDFTQAELRLFVRICSDKNGCFFSGDTCQTIAAGVGFRFENLKTIFKLEQDRQKHTDAQTDFQRPNGLVVKVPEVKQLLINYRTHNGILSCAATLVDLLVRLFPSTVDELDRELGHFQGPKPLLLAETKVNDAVVLIVGSDRKASQIEFGAHQVILVRDQECKQNLPEDFQHCLCMTVLESKGLEFDDVFLWNFLSDSRAEKEWRAILSLMPSDEHGEHPDLKRFQADSEHNKRLAGMMRPLEFSQEQHQILCEELKHLYTAVTRARVRVIVYERDEAKRAPMFYYLNQMDVVEMHSLFVSGPLAAPATGINPEEWLKRGQNLREMNLFGYAVQCFVKAGNWELAAEAKAQESAWKAQSKRGGEGASKSKGRQAPSQAESTALFYRAGVQLLAAEEHYHNKYSVINRDYVRQAARAFYSANEFEIAGRMFELLDDEEHDKVAHRAFLKAGNSDSATDVALRRNSAQIAKACLMWLIDDKDWNTALSILDQANRRFNYSHPSYTRRFFLEKLVDQNTRTTKDPNYSEQERKEATARLVQLKKALQEETAKEAKTNTQGGDAQKVSAPPVEKDMEVFEDSVAAAVFGSRWGIFGSDEAREPEKEKKKEKVLEDVDPGKDDLGWKDESKQVKKKIRRNGQRRRT